MARVAFDGSSRTVSDAPVEVKDMAEAVEWAKRCPNPMPGPSEIELRPVFEAPDFGEAMAPELVEQEDRVRAKVADR